MLFYTIKNCLREGRDLIEGIVIASAARQSRGNRSSSGMDCFVVEFIMGLAKGETRWLLAMTVVD